MPQTYKTRLVCDSFFYYIFFQALVTTELEGGDRQKAMKRLRVPPLGAAQVRIRFRPKFVSSEKHFDCEIG